MPEQQLTASKSAVNSVLGSTARIGKVTGMFNTVLWVYIALLIVGGLMGFIKGKSRISLVSSLIFAVVLALVALGTITSKYVALGIVAFLLVFFGARFMRSKKVMPAGMMTVVSLVVLILLLTAKP
jgi:uncharacterized membrane protein (UPF0136 family)